MERWEYQVVHLNVEPPAPASPPPPPAAAPPVIEPAEGAPPIRVEAVFSKEYLEKEFPGFYGAPPPGGGATREHPANQLRGFLNLQGREGWQLVGFYPVGQLQMMIFRRPLAPPPLAAEQTEVLPEPQSAGPDSAEAPGTADAGGGGPASQAPVLDRILERLEALERQISPERVSRPCPGEEPPSQPGGLNDLKDGEILPPQRWGDLEGFPRVSTPEAAKLLGFRSAASLLNLAARHGYAPGLVKRGVDAALAVYVGSEKSGRGGRDRRLWVVLDPSAG